MQTRLYVSVRKLLATVIPSERRNLALSVFQGRAGFLVAFGFSE